MKTKKLKIILLSLGIIMVSMCLVAIWQVQVSPSRIPSIKYVGVTNKLDGTILWRFKVENPSKDNFHTSFITQYLYGQVWIEAPNQHDEAKMAFELRSGNSQIFEVPNGSDNGAWRVLFRFQRGSTKTRLNSITSFLHIRKYFDFFSDNETLTVAGPKIQASVQ